MALYHIDNFIVVFFAELWNILVIKFGEENVFFSELTRMLQKPFRLCPFHQSFSRLAAHLACIPHGCRAK